MTTQKEYSKEIKENVLRQLKPPINKSVKDIHLEMGIPRTTIYSWVAEARKKGQLIPNSAPANDDKWRKEDKARIVIETYTMNEHELGEYCRKLGLYISDVKRWHQIFESSFTEKKPAKELVQELKQEKEKSKELAKELEYKEKALAEAAALLVLKKKIHSILRDPEED